MTNNDSKEQKSQEEQNRHRTQDAAQAKGVDKKLDGPNRPSV